MRENLLPSSQDVVLLLLENGASVSTINGEGLRPGNLPRDTQVGQDTRVILIGSSYPIHQIISTGHAQPELS